MNPQNNYGLPVTEEVNDDSFKRRLRLLAMLLVTLIIVFGAIFFFTHQTPLEVTSTNPKLSIITTQDPTLKLTFNMPLKASTASVSSNPNIIAASSVSGNTLTLALKSRTMLILHTYTINLSNLRSVSGRKMKDGQISFSPKFATPFITGEEGLKSIGLTDQQVTDINNYNAELDPWAQVVTIDTTSIKHYMLNPSDPWSPWAVSFTESVDNHTFTVVGSFYDTQDIQVTITDPGTNTQVLSAGTPGTI